MTMIVSHEYENIALESVPGATLHVAFTNGWRWTACIFYGPWKVVDPWRGPGCGVLRGVPTWDEAIRLVAHDSRMTLAVTGSDSAKALRYELHKLRRRGPEDMKDTFAEEE